jgi:hypothetical protein
VTGNGLHHRREARDRARPQVVAVGEPTRHDHDVDAAELRLLVPHEPRFADAPAGEQRIAIVATARKLEDAEPHRPPSPFSSMS